MTITVSDQIRATSRVGDSLPRFPSRSCRVEHVQAPERPNRKSHRTERNGIDHDQFQLEWVEFAPDLGPCRTVYRRTYQLRPLCDRLGDVQRFKIDSPSKGGTGGKISTELVPISTDADATGLGLRYERGGGGEREILYLEFRCEKASVLTVRCETRRSDGYGVSTYSALIQ